MGPSFNVAPKFWEEVDKTIIAEGIKGVKISCVNHTPWPRVSLSQTYETRRRGLGQGEGQMYLDRQKSCTPTSLQCTY